MKHKPDHHLKFSVAGLALLAVSHCWAQSACLPSIDVALAKDIEAASTSSGTPAVVEQEKLFVAAERAWDNAVKSCDGDLRAQAIANQTEARRARTHAVEQLGAAACDQAFDSAQRLMEFGRDAWTAKRWDDAARWSRKADLAWESAIAQCPENRRDEAAAQRAAARLDAHNAINCAPRWAKATELSAALRNDLSSLDVTEKQSRRDQIEVAWIEAARACKGAAGEKALATSQTFAKERGDRPLSAATAAEVTAADPVAAKSAWRQRFGDVTYVGQFKRDPNGFMEGQGRVEWDNGDRYEGPLVAGKAQGKGIFSWKSGQRYEGYLKDGRPSGQGKMVYAQSGDRYEGGFEAGIPQGQGTYVWSNGDRYTGAWVSGQKHGHGRYTWASGSTWEGEYLQDERVEGGVGLALGTPTSVPQNATVKE